MALEFFLRNLSTEILQECKKEDIECHHNFINYYLTLLAYDPLWNLYPKMKEIIRLDAVRLIKYVVQKMRVQYCPCVITMKMQFYFGCNFEEKETIINTQRSNFKTRIKPLEDEIVETKTDNPDELALLRKRIIYFITLWRGLGNPTHDAIYQEALYAFKSIYDDADLFSYMNKSKEEKIDELFQLAQICGGIRVYNWITRSEEQQIDDLPKVLSQNLSVLTQEIQTNLKNVMGRIDLLTSVIDYCFQTEVTEYVGLDEATHIRYNIYCELPENVVYEDIEYFKDLLITYRQMEVLLRRLVSEIQVIEESVMILNERLHESQGNFSSLIHLKSGVPTHIIFPLFIELDVIWEDFQNEIIYVKKLHQILTNLNNYVKDSTMNSEKLQLLLQDKPILMDADRLQVGDQSLSDFETSSNVTLVSSTGDMHLTDMKLEFLGFCIWKLVETQGGLIPGNPNLGILQHKGKNYVFSSISGAKCFNKNPEQYVNEALELARKKTELIPLLQLKNDLEAVRLVRELVTMQKVAEQTVVKHDADIQTVLHPVPTYIDLNYKWNIWDFKRDALRMTDMSKRCTVSTMTNVSSQSNPVKTQTYEQREAGNQTRIQNYANTHRPQNYFFGLRGRKDDKQFIVDLTRPPDK